MVVVLLPPCQGTGSGRSKNRWADIRREGGEGGGGGVGGGGGGGGGGVGGNHCIGGLVSGSGGGDGGRGILSRSVVGWATVNARNIGGGGVGGGGGGGG